MCERVICKTENLLRHRLRGFFFFEGVTTENESLFTYQQGKNHASYFHPDYTPIFPDSQELVFEDKSLEEEAKGVCGDSAQCMFDIYTTKKVTIGKASKETVEQFVAVINDTVKPGRACWMFYDTRPAIPWFFQILT